MERGLRRAVLLAVFVACLGACRSPQSQVEAGAALLHVKDAPGATTPDALVVWAYDDTGILWNGERVPKDGVLSPVSKDDLGTILIQPGQLRGALRIHIIGMQEGKAVSDGVLAIAALGGGLRTFDILLSSDEQVDTDGDGVPDSIDNCPTANPRQQNCPESPDHDGGSDGSSVSSDAVSRDDGRPMAEVSMVADGLMDQTVGDVADVGDAPGERTGDIPEPEVGNRDSATEEANRKDVQPEVATVPDLRGDSSTSNDVAPTLDTAIGCDDAGACGKAQGVACARNDECASGQCADGVCCTNSCVGACRSCSQPNAVGTCQGYASGTDPERECATGATGATCNGAGACGAPPTNLANGQLCTGGSQCTSHICKDGVCCNTACTNPCQTCGNGTCTAVKRTDDVPECTGAMTCNGRGVCVGR